jgi:hypothetical protein
MMSTNQLGSEISPNTVAIPPTPLVSDEVRAAAERLGVGRYFDEVIAFTVEIFGSFSNVEHAPDPEVPDWEHIVFEVPVRGETDDILEKSRRWSRRLRETIPRAPRVFSFVMDYEE